MNLTIPEKREFRHFLYAFLSGEIYTFPRKKGEKSMIRKIVCILLAVLLAVSALPALAATPTDGSSSYYYKVKDSISKEQNLHYKKNMNFWRNIKE